MVSTKYKFDALQNGDKMLSKIVKKKRLERNSDYI